jgi:DNA transposition AAA+ family ATPase
MKHQGPIPPDKAAFKIAAVQNFLTPKFREQTEKCPRVREVLWSLQSHSRQPGGLMKHVENLLEQFPDRIGTAAMHAIGKTDKPYTRKEREAVLESIPKRVREWDYPREPFPISDAAFDFWDSIESVSRVTAEPQIDTNDARVNSLNDPQFREVCLKAALEDLPRHLFRFCTPEHAGDDESDAFQCEDIPLENVWYFRDLLGALVEMLDVHAARVLDEIAETEVTLKVFDALNYAASERALVLLEGNSRFGKTQSVKTYCAAWPGKVRLFSTPCTNGEKDLYEAVAEAFGISFSLKTTTRELRAKIEFIIRHGGLMLCADEAHFLWPSYYSRNTTPMRLNWLRTQITDRDCPLVLVTTPQDFAHRAEKFVKHTGFNAAQFTGRTMRTVRLPDALDTADLIAVAKKHFPELSENYLRLIAAKAMQSESYLAAVQQIAKLARYLAKRDNRPEITLEDLDLAIAEVIPGSVPPAPVPALPAAIAPAVRKTANPVAVKRGTRPAAAPVAVLEAPARETSPTLQPA